MLTYSYTAFLFYVPIYCSLLDKYHSQFIEYQENKQPRNISERKICAYTKSQKNGAFQIEIQKNRAIHILFVEKKGANHRSGGAEKGGHSARTSVLCHI